MAVTKSVAKKKVSAPVVVNEEPIAPIMENVSAVNEVETVKEEKPVKKASTAKAKKVFDDKDLIPCVSIVSGKLFYEGARSHNLYHWADADDIQEIEYRDLKYGVMAKDKAIFNPRFIIQDKDFVSEYPELENFYGAVYSTKELIAMLSLSPAQLKKKVEGLPDGAKELLKTIVSGRIDNGQFDSVQRINVLDEVLGTEMILKLTAK